MSSPTQSNAIITTDSPSTTLPLESSTSSKLALKSLNVVLGAHENPVEAIILTRNGKIFDVMVVQETESSIIEAIHKEWNVKDYGDLFIFPGLVDSNVHLHADFNTDWENITYCTELAAAGGVTTIVDNPVMSTTYEDSEEYLKCLQTRIKQIKAKSKVDFGVMGLLEPKTLADANKILEAGVMGLKCFLLSCYQNSVGHFERDAIKDVLEELETTCPDTLLMIHPELATERELYLTSPCRLVPMRKRLDMDYAIKSVEFGGAANKGSYIEELCRKKTDKQAKVEDEDDEFDDEKEADSSFMELDDPSKLKKKIKKTKEKCEINDLVHFELLSYAYDNNNNSQEQASQSSDSDSEDLTETEKITTSKNDLAKSPTVSSLVQCTEVKEEAEEEENDQKSNAKRPIASIDTKLPIEVESPDESNKHKQGISPIKMSRFAKSYYVEKRMKVGDIIVTLPNSEVKEQTEEDEETPNLEVQTNLSETVSDHSKASFPISRNLTETLNQEAIIEVDFTFTDQIVKAPVQAEQSTPQEAAQEQEKKPAPINIWSSLKMEEGPISQILASRRSLKSLTVSSMTQVVFTTPFNSVFDGRDSRRSSTLKSIGSSYQNIPENAIPSPEKSNPVELELKNTLTRKFKNKNDLFLGMIRHESNSSPKPMTPEKQDKPQVPEKIIPEMPSTLVKTPETQASFFPFRSENSQFSSEEKSSTTSPFIAAKAVGGSSSSLLQRRISLRSTMSIVPSMNSTLTSPGSNFSRVNSLDLFKTPEETARKEAKFNSCYRTFLANRPQAWEENAVSLILNTITAETKLKIVFQNLSLASSFEKIRELKAENETFATKVYGDTSSSHLSFTEKHVKQGETKFKVSPPFRNKDNKQLLAEYLKLGGIDLVSSFHFYVPPKYKLVDKGNFRRAFGGLDSMGCSLQATWTALYVHQQKNNKKFNEDPEHQRKMISLIIKQLHNSLCSNPANILKISDRKGTIAKGKDADFVVWDPYQKDTNSNLKSNHVFSGKIMMGSVHKTYLRGNLIFDKSNSEQVCKSYEPQFIRP